jgi:hypothetical protein
MASSTEVTYVDTYELLGKLTSKTGIFGFRKYRDPSSELNILINNFLNERKTKFNQAVADAHDISGEYQKFEFFDTDERAEYLDDSKSETISKGSSGKLVKFKSEARVGILYVKVKSLIYFYTTFNFVVLEPGCISSKSEVHYHGGKHYSLEEIYFNKISTVSTQRYEVDKQFLDAGCFKDKITRSPLVSEKIIIRAGDSYPISAHANQASELRDARALINKKVSDVN